MRSCIVVNTIVTEQEVVIKSLGRRIGRTRFVSGVTILRSGAVALVQNTGRLICRARCRTSLVAGDNRSSLSHDENRKRLLVVDDSVTTRYLSASFFCRPSSMLSPQLTGRMLEIVCSRTGMIS